MVCTRCGQEKNASDLLTDRRQSRGFRRTCKPCSRGLTKQWRIENRELRQAVDENKRRDNQSWIDGVKLGLPCDDCGRSFPTCSMDYDHRDAETKSFGVSYAARVGKRREAVMAEIAKCDLVCSNCHRVRTKMRSTIRRNTMIQVKVGMHPAPAPAEKPEINEGDAVVIADELGDKTFEGKVAPLKPAPKK